MIDPISYHVSVGKISYVILESQLEIPEPFWLCNQVLGIPGKHNISPKLAIPTSSCIHPSTHNQETFGNHLPQPSKIIRYTSYDDTPELPPQYWVASRLSHQRTA